MLATERVDPMWGERPLGHSRGKVDPFSPRACCTFTLKEEPNRRTTMSFGLKLAFASIACVGGGTASTPGFAQIPSDMLQSAGTTSENIATPRRRRFDSVPAALAEIRRRTLMNWEQIAAIFGVSRRAVHLWSSGGNLNPGNLAVLNRLFDAVEKAPAERPHDLRDTILARYGLSQPESPRETRQAINPGPIWDAGPEIEVPHNIVGKSYARAAGRHA